MNKISKNVKCEIALNLELLDILRINCVDKGWKKICDEIFWMKKVGRDFPQYKFDKDGNFFEKPGLFTNWKEIYIFLHGLAFPKLKIELGSIIHVSHYIGVITSIRYKNNKPIELRGKTVPLVVEFGKRYGYHNFVAKKDQEWKIKLDDCCVSNNIITKADTLSNNNTWFYWSKNLDIPLPPLGSIYYITTPINGYYGSNNDIILKVTDIDYDFSLFGQKIPLVHTDIRNKFVLIDDSSHSDLFICGYPYIYVESRHLESKQTFDDYLDNYVKSQTMVSFE